MQMEVMKPKLSRECGCGGLELVLVESLLESGPDPLPTLLQQGVRADLSLLRRSSPQALQSSCYHATSPASLWYVVPPGKGLYG